MGLICFHKWSEWEEKGYHLERRCLKCGKVQVKYPDAVSILMLLLRDAVITHLKHVETIEKMRYGVDLNENSGR